MASAFVRLWGLTESKTNDIIKPLVGMRVPTTETNIYQLERIALGARTPMQCVLTLEGKEMIGTDLLCDVVDKVREITGEEYKGVEKKYMITLRDLLKLMDDFNLITIVLSKKEVQVFPLFALEFFKDSVLDMNVVRVDGSTIYIGVGGSNKNA